MKNLLLLVLIISTTGFGPARAQQTPYKFYRSLESYMAKEYDSVKFFEIIPRYGRERHLRHPARYGLEADIFCEDPEDTGNNWFLNKEVLLFEDSSKLYINCNRIKGSCNGTWYAPAVEINGDIFFLSFPNPNKYASIGVAAAITAVGAVGVALGSHWMIYATPGDGANIRELYRYDPSTRKSRMVGFEEACNLFRVDSEILDTYIFHVSIDDYMPPDKIRYITNYTWQCLNLLKSKNIDPKAYEQTPPFSLPPPLKTENPDGDEKHL